MLIELGKKYKTLDGRKVTILKTDLKNPYPVVAVVVQECGKEIIVKYTLEGKYFTGGNTSHDDLVEVSQYDEFKIDDKVIVWNGNGITKYKRYFAGVSTKGKPMAWTGGTTSFSCGGNLDITEWENCELVK